MYILSDAFFLSWLPYKDAKLHILELDYDEFVGELDKTAFKTTFNCGRNAEVASRILKTEIPLRFEPIVLTKHDVLFVIQTYRIISRNMPDEGFKTLAREGVIKFYKIWLESDD